MLDIRFALINTGLLLVASLGAWMARRPGSRVLGPGSGWLAASLLSALAFLGVKVFEYRTEVVAGLLPKTSTFLATYFTLTGLHALHVVGAIVATVWILATARRAGAMTAGRLKCLALYWGLVEIVWLAILGTVYFS